MTKTELLKIVREVSSEMLNVSDKHDCQKIEEAVMKLPDDQPQEPCIPVSVIRERIAKETKDWEPDGLNPNYLSGIRDCYKWWGQWLDHQVGQEPQPEPGDGWEFTGSSYFRLTKTGLKFWVVRHDCGDFAFWVLKADHKVNLLQLGIRHDPESAKALAERFAKANGGWA